MNSTNSNAKMQGLFCGLQYCYSLGVSDVLVESDFKMIVNMIYKKGKPLLNFSSLWEDILELYVLLLLRLDILIKNEIKLLTYLLKKEPMGLEGAVFL